MIICLAVTDFFDIAESMAVVAASITALWGINSWRNEAKWKRKYELAEEVLVLFYQAEECISRIRHPLAYNDEGTTREKNPHESEDETRLLNRANVVYERYKKEEDIFIQLRKIRHRFKAVFNHGG